MKLLAACCHIAYCLLGGVLGMHKVYWRMTLIVYEQYLELLEKLAVLSPDYDYEEYMQTCEELGSLKGFPTNTNIDEDVIVVKLPTNTPPLVALNVHE